MDYYYDPNIEVFIRSYRDYLKSGGVLRLTDFLPIYQKINSVLHSKAGVNDEIDSSAFIYCFLRLPEVIYRVKKIVLAQTDEIFLRFGYKVEFWQEVSAPARRRKMIFDGKETLGVFINSVSDVDDLVCLLSAFQTEWNKIKLKIKNEKLKIKENFLNLIKEKLGINDDQWQRLGKIWKGKYLDWLEKIIKIELDFKIELLRGSYVDYQKAAQKWFENVLNKTRYSNFSYNPLYFVSSNTHSLVNIITGWVNQYEKELIDYLYDKKYFDLLNYWKEIKQGNHQGSRENFLWYVLKKYEADNPALREKRKNFELSIGIDYIAARHFLDINVQIINLEEIGRYKKIRELKKSVGYIFNIDYPLGFGAYMVLSTLLHNTNLLKGVYILGKASFLNGNLGDIGLPTFIIDSHSRNQFIIKNSIDQKYFNNVFQGSVLTGQKAISVKGTFLQTRKMMEDYFQNGVNIIEMENGPYLNALYEMTHYNRYPEGKVIDLTRLPVDLGIIHYASDNPFTKAITLGTRNLGYEGVDATYCSSLAIFNRIIDLESKNL